MTISIRLLESDKQITKNINQAIADRINGVIKNRSGEIVKETKKLIPGWIKSQPEMISLLSSSTTSLVGQFGIYQNTSQIVNVIADSISNSVSIKTKLYNSNLSNGGLELQVQPINFANLLSLPEGHTIYQDGDLHWLNWLLTRGDEIIVVGYEYNPQTGLGRSKLGNMKEGTSFRVPPQFSGTEDNNFITRALSGAAQETAISKIFSRILGQ